jgi:hypothetical protein
MSSRALNAFKSIFLQGNFHRIWQILLKSRLIHPIGALRGVFAPQIKKFRRELVQGMVLDEEQRRIADELKQQGFARVDSLYQAADFAGLQNYLNEKTKNIEHQKSQQLLTNKDFWVRLSDEDFAKGMTSDHPLVALSLKERVLQVVSDYLGQAAFLEYLLLTYSLPSNQPLKSSQLWHQDHDNDRMLKLFFYLSDVQTVEDGPFTLLPKAARDQIQNSFFPRHLADAEVNSQYPLSQAVQIKGPQFSAFLVDTSVCYHMGSRVAAGHSRLMSTTLFVTLPKAYPGSVRSFVQATTPLSSLQKAAVHPQL